MTNPISRVFGHAALAALCLGSLGAPGTASAADAETLAPLAFLGLTAAEGKTETGDDAGKLEAQLLLAPLVQAAASSIWGASKLAANNRQIIAKVGDTGADLKPYVFARRRLDAIKQALGTIPNGGCAAAAFGGVFKGLTESTTPKPDLSAQSLFTTGFALAKSDVKVAGVTADASDELVLNALAKAASGTGQLRLVQDIQSLGPNDPENGLWADFISASRQLATLAKAGCADSKVYGSQMAYVGGELADLAKGGENGAPSLLEQSLLLEGVAKSVSGADGPLLLVVNREKSGGTMINKRNVFTTIGFEGLSFRSGIVLSYRLVDPQSGTVQSAGVVSCGTRPVGFKRIYSVSTRAADTSDCSMR